MQDNFKNYIDDNVDEFDHLFDVEKGWANFSKKNTPKKSKTLLWAVAASMALFIGVFGVNFMMGSGAPKQLSEWEEVELFYQNQIDDMTIMVTNYSSDKEFLYDLEEMDKAFLEIKDDLQDDAANEEVIEAMMNHYRLKLEILEKMLDEIREDNETSKSTIGM